ncbi:hypothetical protein B0181_09225 [Moraxella caviae]|uniref:Phage replication protein O, N-terminal domain n=1 Tax=Moraxella caviae TaxID=34060 RepID=A0A1S9ZX21_9GAMM|nr:replication protein [Moraxella caviae]OOR88000.1 hypothetical protein B0181_09225 [Moraxella caviae]STZ14022.1 phage replication protein O, N-terminal domain [Moraxella caviae]STZ14494.1 phage replication protein O, N-terminal domain [Moraxella caviae]VEW11326.1 phage replication protein O, N-terminal domain [Moraxella caviae]VEW12842.1 phage replication protein O, N-terminal domain [Moraxella caviae]
MSNFIPNSFQVPNAFVDEMLDKISGNACKVYLLIVRKTRGWNKEADRISYSQIQRAAGIARATVSGALDELEAHGLIKVKHGGEKSANEYSLNDDFSGSKIEPVKNCTSSKNAPAGSKIEPKPSSKIEHTEIHNTKTTYTKNKSEYVHTHQNLENPKDLQSDEQAGKTSSAKKSNADKKFKKYLTADDLVNLTLSDCKFSDDDLRNYPNLGEWIFVGMDSQIASDYLAQRSKGLTLTALKMTVRQASIAGLTLCQALEVCITTGKGWDTFNAEWYANRQKPFTPQPKNRMEELRQMTSNAATNFYVDDLPQVGFYHE